MSTTLTVNTEATTQDLINTALDFSKYGSDAEAMEYLNDVLSELRWRMSEPEYSAFNNRVNELIVYYEGL